MACNQRTNQKWIDELQKVRSRPSASSVFGIMLSMTGLKKELDRSDQAVHNLRYYSAASELKSVQESAATEDGIWFAMREAASSTLKEAQRLRALVKPLEEDAARQLAMADEAGKRLDPPVLNKSDHKGKPRSRRGATS